MTLDELQVVITANITQLAPQINEIKKQFSGLGKAAETTSQDMSNAAEKSADKTKKALDTETNAQNKAAEAAKNAAKVKSQAAADITAAIKREQERQKGMSTGQLSPEEWYSLAHPDTGGQKRSMTATGIMSERETSASAPEPAQNIGKLQAAAVKTRQALTDMFGAAKQGAAEASAETELLIKKLDLINAQADIQQRKLVDLQAEYQRVASSGADSKSALKLQSQIVSTESRLLSLTSQSDKLSAQIRRLDEGLSSTGSSASRAAQNVQKVNSELSRTGFSTSKAAQGMQKMGSSFKSAGSGASSFSRELSMMRRQILSQILIYGILMKGLSTFGTYMWSALKTNTAFSNSLNNLKVQLLTAFQPIYQAALPALTSLINAMAKTMAYIAAFISGFFGKTYAQSQQSAAGLNKNVKALENMEKAAKNAKKSLAGFDQINQIGNKDTASATPTGADKSLINTDFSSPSAKPLISEEQIRAAEEAGERIRSVFDKIYRFVKQYEGPIKTVIVGIITAFLLFKTITFVVGIVSGIASAFAFLAANPAVAVVVAIAAIIAALVALYMTNQQFRDIVNGAWTSVKITILDAWNAISDNVIAGWKNVISIFQNLWDTVLKPVIDQIGQVWDNLWTNHLAPLYNEVKDFIEKVINDVLNVWNKTLAPFIDWMISHFGPPIATLLKGTATVFGDFFGIISDVVKDIIKALGGIVDFISGVFTGDWKKAWQGVKDIFGGIFDGICDLFKGAINLIIDGINAFTETLNWIPEELSKVPGFGWAADFKIGQIPHLAQGCITDVNNPMLAVIGDNKTQREVVSPLGDLKNMIAEVVKNAAGTGTGTGDMYFTFPIYLDRNGSLLDTIVKKVSRNTRSSNVSAF